MILVCVCVCVCACVVIPFILDVRVVDPPLGVTQEGHSGFVRLPSAELALIFIAKRIQPFLSLLDSKSNFVYPRNNRSSLLVGHDFLLFIYLFIL